jgi:hypothetical protein
MPRRASSRDEYGVTPSEVTEPLVGEVAWIRKCEEMASPERVDHEVQAGSGDARLELDRKKPIVAPGDHAYRNFGPSREVTGFAEHDVGLGALVRLALPDDFGRDVVQEVCGKVEFRAVPTALCSPSARRNRSGVVPPLTCGLARKRNHGVD